MHILKVPFQHCLISVQALATEVLRTNTSLVVLNLESNRITRKGIKVLHQRVLHFTLNNLATVVHIPACWLTYETPTRLISNYQGHIKQWEDSCINVFIMCRMKTVFLVKNVKKKMYYLQMFIFQAIMKAIAENPHIALKELRLANQVSLPVECMHM